jgi:hypothetical protein
VDREDHNYYEVLNLEPAFKKEKRTCILEE